MQTQALAEAGCHIPPRPSRRGPHPALALQAADLARARTAFVAGARGMRHWVAYLGPVQEASLVGIVSLLAFWGLAELALLLGDY